MDSMKIRNINIMIERNNVEREKYYYFQRSHAT